MTARRWTAAELRLMRLRLALGDKLAEIAVRLGRTSREIGLAQWTSLGRTEAAALAILNAGLPLTPPKREGVRAFLAQMFGAAR